MIKGLKVMHIWCKEDDRWLYLEFDDNAKIVGINFCQGDDYESFKDTFACPDKKLMRFYDWVCHFLQSSNAPFNLIFINKVCRRYYFNKSANLHQLSN